MNRRMGRAAVAGALAAMAMVVAQPGAAQVVTDGTLGRAGALAGPNFAVTADLGRQVGANLFHSFSQFDIARGQGATFSGPAGIANILSRVTGGAGSVIDGTLRSTIPGADFYFFNPAGVAFGPNASIDVGGAFHVASAHHVRLADGGRFDAADPGASTLTAAPPAAFGFLGGQGAVYVEGAYLWNSSRSAITIAGGDVGIGYGATVATDAAPIGVASLSGAGEVALGRGGISGVTGPRGTIVLVDGRLVSSSVDGLPAGAITLVGGDILVAEDSDVNASNGSAGPGGGITVDATGLLLLSQSRLYSDTYPLAGASGDIRVSAPTVIVQDESSVQTSSLGVGNAGDVVIAAQDVTVTGASRISATSWGDGDAGAIRLNASRSVTLELRGNLSASSNGAGAAGAIEVRTDRLVVEGGFIASTVQDLGRSGSITLDVGELQLLEGFVSASGSVLGSGDAGDIIVRASRGVTIEGFLSGLSTTTADGRGGDIRVVTPSLLVADAGTITSSTFGTGPAGDITLEVGRLHVGDMGDISATSGVEAAGPGGSVTIRATDGVTVASGPFGGITSTTFGSGSGGNVTIEAPRVELLDGGIYASTLGSGRAGSIAIRAGEHVIVDSSRFAGGIRAGTDDSGPGGDISIETPRLTLLGAGGLEVAAAGSGAGGTITVDADTVRLDEGAQIRSYTLASGRGGTVDLRARAIGIAGGSQILAFSAGEGAGGDVLLQATGNIAIAGEGGDTATTGIFASSEGPGAGGNVRLSAPAIAISDAGYVFAGARGSGPGGSVAVSGRDFLVTRMGFIDVSSYDSGPAGSLAVDMTGSVTVTGSNGTSASSALGGGSSGSGAGGTVSIRAPVVRVDDGAIVTSVSRGTGRGGDIAIEAGELLVGGGAAVTASSRGAGNAGDVTVRTSGSVRVEGSGYGFSSGIAAESGASGDGGRLDISAPVVEVRDGALVTTQGFGTGAAGDIRIAAADLLVVADGASIATQTVQSDGGNIAIEGLGVVQLTGGEITTSVQGGAGDGGNITIAGPQHVVLGDSRIQANAYGGDGGNITIDSLYFLASPRSVVEASSQLGVSGTITVTAPVVDVGAGLGVLPAGFFDASRLLREACASRAGESENSFVVAGRGSMPESAWGPYGSRSGRAAKSPCEGGSR